MRDSNTEAIITNIRSYSDTLYQTYIDNYDATHVKPIKSELRTIVYYKLLGYTDRVIENYKSYDYSVILSYICSETRAILDAIPTK